MGKSKDAFRTISEVAEWLETQAHVLRFWESKFSQVKPVKRAGGRRYYRPADMLLLGGIKKLLHDDGMTIKGAQKLLREKGVKHVSGLSQPLEEDLTDDLHVKADKKSTEDKDTAAVLEFSKPAKSESKPDEDPAEMIGDLLLAGQGTDPEATDDSTEDAAALNTPELAEDDPLPAPDQTPALMQRSSQGQQGTDTSGSDTSDDTAAKEANAPQTDGMNTENATLDAPDEPEEKPITSEPEIDTMDPGNSLLPDLSRVIGIVPGKSASVRDLLQKMQTLRDQIAQSENA